MHTSNINRYFILAKGILLVVLPILLIILPKTFFDNGPAMCVFTFMTRHRCPGCGMARACMRLIHLDLQGAWAYNKVSFIVLPILCYLLVIEYVKFIKQFKIVTKNL